MMRITIITSSLHSCRKVISIQQKYELHQIADEKLDDHLDQMNPIRLTSNRVRIVVQNNINKKQRSHPYTSDDPRED